MKQENRLDFERNILLHQMITGEIRKKDDFSLTFSLSFFLIEGL